MVIASITSPNWPAPNLLTGSMLLHVTAAGASVLVRGRAGVAYLDVYGSSVFLSLSQLSFFS